MLLLRTPSSCNHQMLLFYDTAWMLTFGRDSKTGSKSRFDFTDNSAGSLARLRLISDATW